MSQRNSRGDAIVVSAVLILVLGVTAAAAQDRQLGVRFGASVATVRGGDDAGAAAYDYRNGLTGGVFAVLPVSRRLALQFEAMVTDRGGSTPLHDPALIQGTLEGKFRFQHIDLPVLARLSGPRIGGTALFAFAGPTLSIRTQAKYQRAYGPDGTFGFEDDIGPDAARWDAGLTIGAGADVGRRLVIDARYTRGLNDVVNARLAPSLTSRAFLVTAGFRVF